jgi:hypothetical protein
MNRRSLLRLAFAASATGAASAIVTRAGARGTDSPASGRPFEAVLPGLAGGDGNGVAVQHQVEPAAGGDDQTAPSGLTVQGMSLLGAAKDTYGTSIGGSWIAGEVLNGLDHPVANVQVQIVIGEFTRTVTGRLTIVPPGGTTSFLMTVPGVLQPGDSPVATVVGFDDPATGPTTEALVGHADGPEEVNAGPPDPRTGVQPKSQEVFGIPGTIHNTTKQAWLLQEAVLTGYDPQGNVVLLSGVSDFDIPFAGLGDDVLHAGQTAKFEGYFPRPDYNAVQGLVTIKVTVNAQPQ